MDLEEKLYCEVCGTVDEYYEEFADMCHSRTPKHICNVILKNYKLNKRFFSGNRDGILISCDAESQPYERGTAEKIVDCSKHKTRIYAKPNQGVKFSFRVSNDMKKEDVMVVGIQLGHPQPQFQINNHCYIFGEEPHILKKKSSINEEICVQFVAPDIGQYEMPIMFTFYRPDVKQNLVFVREMVINVNEDPTTTPFVKSPFKNTHFAHGKIFMRSPDQRLFQPMFEIPKLLKTLLTVGLSEEALEKLRVSQEMKQQLRIMLIATRAIFDEGITKENYIAFFHHLLWWEEIIAIIKLKKYNMSGVAIERKVNGSYWLDVPGLAEKRPSVLRGDRALIRPEEPPEIVFESFIIDIKENRIELGKLDPSFTARYKSEAKFEIRFLMSRVPMERMHLAVALLFRTQQDCRIFPQPLQKVAPVKPISKFYNPLIKQNEEQRSAIEHIVSRTSGQAPYIVFGPPGTGKTMTIVEAIVQIVVSNPRNRVMVCTDSNMAADHVALTLLNVLKNNKDLNINKFIFRANSRDREWSIMPPELVPVSNGSCEKSFSPVSNAVLASYRICVTTLMHAAKYGICKHERQIKLTMTHLFIDEAAQAMEPAALIPITGLLAPTGQLVLAGDPQQLGPVCLSRNARDAGLGKSLLERLWMDYTNLYGTDDPNYITTLVKNFRSDPDILQIPNELFYKKKPLEPHAKPDPLSKVSILGLPGGDRALVFHSVNSREQRMGNAPSYFNEKEMAMVQRYTKALISTHNVSNKDIGIIAPYIRQVYKIKEWLKREKYEEIEVGTVEAFQGKEKRVILVSTVRANCRLLEYDAKYGLGFLVDDKRFNVALTRAKAKIIIIGNPACLIKDLKWRRYMEVCKENSCYFGQETEQLARTSELLVEVSRKRFDMCRLTEALKTAPKLYTDKKNQI